MKKTSLIVLSALLYSSVNTFSVSQQLKQQNAQTSNNAFTNIPPLSLDIMNMQDAGDYGRAELFEQDGELNLAETETSWECPYLKAQREANAYKIPRQDAFKQAKADLESKRIKLSKEKETEINTYINDKELTIEDFTAKLEAIKSQAISAGPNWLDNSIKKARKQAYQDLEALLKEKRIVLSKEVKSKINSYLSDPALTDETFTSNLESIKNDAISAGPNWLDNSIKKARQQDYKDLEADLLQQRIKLDKDTKNQISSFCNDPALSDDDFTNKLETIKSQAISAGPNWLDGSIKKARQQAFKDLEADLLNQRIKLDKNKRNEISALCNDPKVSDDDFTNKLEAIKSEAISAGANYLDNSIKKSRKILYNDLSSELKEKGVKLSKDVQNQFNTDINDPKLSDGDFTEKIKAARKQYLPDSEDSFEKKIEVETETDEQKAT